MEKLIENMDNDLKKINISFADMLNSLSSETESLDAPDFLSLKRSIDQFETSTDEMLTELIKQQDDLDATQQVSTAPEDTTNTPLFKGKKAQIMQSILGKI
ncbi:hypothetical protein BB561_002603 [Smittium simulii]|uniref:Uncharacterized protein n=1 Tax=Smittium simulii TaxID=133385 RepID=A0A2T9YPR6_9FUNG|nr:hypothetical protein BB561_002603 [Smittium simulii]